jgi:hypothetical protein
MKKITLQLLIILLLAGHGMKGQAFQSGTNVLGIGVGIGGYYDIGSYSSQSPALGISYEHGMSWHAGGGVIGLGGYFGYKTFSYHYDYPFIGNYYIDEKWTYMIIGIRGAYHYDFAHNDKLDTYGGIMISFDNLSYSYNDTYYTAANGYPYYSHPNSYSSGLYPTLFVGARYYLSNSIGIFAEGGYGISYITIGINFKF